LDAFRAVLAEAKDVKLGANKDTSTAWGRNVEHEYRLPLDEPDGKARTAILDSLVAHRERLMAEAKKLGLVFDDA